MSAANKHRAKLSKNPANIALSWQNGLLADAGKMATSRVVNTEQSEMRTMTTLFPSVVRKLPLFLVTVFPALAFGGTSLGETQQLLTILKETAIIAEATNRLALLVFGGSVAALLSSSYLQPKTRLARLAYLLFVPGWFALMWAMYRGHEVSNVYLSAMHVADKPELFYKLEALWRLEEQSAALYLSLVPFSLWLIIFLVWWIRRGEHGSQ